MQLSEAKNAGADLVFLPIYYTPASLILNQANTMGYMPKFFGVDGMDGILTVKNFDTSLAEGVMLLTPLTPMPRMKKRRTSCRSIRNCTAMCPISLRQMPMTAYMHIIRH